MVSALLVAVLGITSVSIASAAPQPGGSCKVAGKVRVTNTGTLKCERKAGSLRWTQVTAPTATSDAPPSTGKPVVATPIAVVTSVHAPQVTDVSVDNSAVRFTISGMSPDTGVYAVQWVEAGQSFNTYRMSRFTDRAISIGTSAFLGCGHSYTFRVFVMRADWKLSDGHQTQNVTPHSTPFDVTFSHPCSTGASDPVPCASGGECAVGDTGPGGGIVFYVASGTFSCGLSGASTCKYLEAAPANWNGAGGDPNISWSTDTDPGAGRGNQTTSVPGADGTAIGTGYQNSLDISNQYGNASVTAAAVKARLYYGGSKNDWHLPSKDELNELYLKRATVGGFADDTYWSSSESASDKAWRQNMTLSNRFTYDKFDISRVRPIRAFGSSSSWIQIGADFDGGSADDLFGYGVSVSSDGNIVAVGAPNAYPGGGARGETKVFALTSGVWEQRGSTITGVVNGDYAGKYLDLSADGNVVAVPSDGSAGGGTERGAVRVYSWSGSAWVQRGSTINGEADYDSIGRVALSEDGSVLAIGSQWNDGVGSDAGHVRVYAWNGSAWVQRGADIDGEAADDRSGASVDLSADGSVLAVGAPQNDDGGTDAGQVRVFTWNGSSWLQRGADIEGPAFRKLGITVSLSADGLTVAAGAPAYDAGRVVVYSWSGSTWLQRGSTVNGETFGEKFGASLGLSGSGDVLVVGAYVANSNGANSGRVKVYAWSNSAWIQRGPNFDGEAAGDYFGEPIAISKDGSTIVSGAQYNDGAASNAGHARVFRYS